MNTFVRIIIVSLLSLTFAIGAFAESGTNISSRAQSEVNKEKIQNIESNTTETSDSEATNGARREKIKQEVSSYIIDSYKAQGDKILKDIDQTLQKTVPDKLNRVEAYDKIQASLEARREKNNTSAKISDTSKTIIDAFLSHMIDSIEKKKKEIKE